LLIAYLKSVDEQKYLLDKLLNQGRLVINWHRQIQNKGNEVAMFAI